MFPSSRYEHYEFIEDNEVQITLNEDGTLSILGYPDKELLDQLLDSDFSFDEEGRIGPSSHLLPFNYETTFFGYAHNFFVPLSS